MVTSRLKQNNNYCKLDMLQPINYSGTFENNKIWSAVNMKQKMNHIFMRAITLLKIFIGTLRVLPLITI